MAKGFHVAQYKDEKPTIEESPSPNKYRKQKDKEYAELEKELAKAQGEVEEAEDEVEKVSAEEKEAKEKGDEHNWKKRYSDARSYFARKEQEFQNQIEELKQKLDAQTNQPQYPTTDEEFEEWIQKYPKVAAAMQTMILKNSEGTKKEFQQTKKELETERQRIAFERAYAQLLKIHPDFDDIRVTEQFQDWLADQAVVIQNTINNPGTFDDEAVKAAATTVTMYKRDNGLDKKKKSTTQNPDDAAKPVARSKSESPETDGKPKFSESQIASMSSQEFEKNADAIMAAQREGRFEYDLSGAAR